MTLKLLVLPFVCWELQAWWKTQLLWEKDSEGQSSVLANPRERKNKHRPASPDFCCPEYSGWESTGRGRDSRALVRSLDNKVDTSGPPVNWAVFTCMIILGYSTPSSDERVTFYVFSSLSQSLILKTFGNEISMNHCSAGRAY